MRVGRIATATFMVLAAVWAPQIENFGSLFKYLQSVLAYISPPIVAVFILGVFWRRANGTAAFVSLLVGLAVSLFLLTFQVIVPAPWMPDIHFLHVAPILFLFSGLTVVLVSLAGAPPPEEKTRDTTWSPAFFRRESSELRQMAWYQNYRVLAILVLLLTAVVVAMFW
jgi:SSS family solute:Na+ symporter